MDKGGLIVIGGSGFIGTNLINLYEGNCNIINLDRRESLKYNHLTYRADIRNLDDLRDKMSRNHDWVISLAAEHRDDVSPASLYYDVNVNGTRNILKAMEEKGINKIIFTSSVAVYGLNKNNPDTDHPADPFNDYGKSKWQAEEALREWYQKAPGERTLIILRPTVVFGPGNRGNVYNLLNQLTKGRFLMVGRGINKKSMAYVENIVSFIQYCIHHDLGGYHVFNYVDKPDLTTKELVEITERALNKRLPPIRIPYYLGYLGGMGFDVLSKIIHKKFSISSVRIKKFCATTQFSNNSIKDNTDFEAPYTLMEGLTKTIQSIASGNDHPISSGSQ